MKSLKIVAEAHNFRPPEEGEMEAEYRCKLADHVRPLDLIESEEIRNGTWWGTWTNGQNRALVGDLTLNKLMASMWLVRQVPWYEVRLAQDAVAPFTRCMSEVLMPLGPSPTVHPVMLGGIPVEVDPYMPKGMGLLVQRFHDGLYDVVMIFKVVGGTIQCF